MSDKDINVEERLSALEKKLDTMASAITEKGKEQLAVIEKKLDTMAGDPDEKKSQDQLKVIEEKIDVVSKKLSEKWVLPVCLAVLGALLTLGNFFITNAITSKNIATDAAHDSFGKLQGEMKAAFYKNCRENLRDIDEQFDSYCSFNQDSPTRKAVFDLLITFTKSYDALAKSDQELLQPTKAYAQFVGNTMADMSDTFDKSKIPAIYEKSKELYYKAFDSLDKGLVKAARD